MAEEPILAEEIKKMEYEPLNSVEKKLISYSLILGVVLLGVLVAISYTYFPGAPEPAPVAAPTAAQTAPAATAMPGAATPAGTPASTAAPTPGK